MAPKVTDEHIEARKEQILMAALQCFAEKGHTTTIKDICAKSGLSTGAVYSYFGSKEEILEALREWGKQQNEAAFFPSLPQDSTAREAITQVLRAFIQRCKDPAIQTAIRADVMFMAEALTNETVAALGCNEYEQMMETIIAMVAGARDSGCTNPDVDTRAVAEALFALVAGMHTQLIVNPKLDLDAYARAVEALVFSDYWKSDAGPACKEP